MAVSIFHLLQTLPVDGMRNQRAVIVRAAAAMPVGLPDSSVITKKTTKRGGHAGHTYS